MQEHFSVRTAVLADAEGQHAMQKLKQFTVRRVSNGRSSHLPSPRANDGWKKASEQLWGDATSK
jgi:hypothetical protein